MMNKDDQGLSKDHYLIAFCLSCFIASTLIGLVSNLPVPAGVGLGCATYFTYSLTGSEYPSKTPTSSAEEEQLLRATFGANVCVIAALIMLALAAFGLPELLFRMTPNSVKGAMPVGIGLLLALHGFELV